MLGQSACLFCGPSLKAQDIGTVDKAFEGRAQVNGLWARWFSVLAAIQGFALTYLELLTLTP